VRKWTPDEQKDHPDEQKNISPDENPLRMNAV